MLDYCEKSSINAVVSLFDLDVLKLATHRQEFAAIGVQVLHADEDSIRICNDKWMTFQFLQELGIATPKTYLALSDTKQAIAANELSYPVMIKPRWGTASIGIFTADDEDEMDVLYRKSAKEAFGSHLKYESSFTPDQAIIIQEKVEGIEHGIDVLNDLEGNYVATWVKKKVAMRAGETDLGQTVSPSRFESIAKMLSENIRHQALLAVDCFVSNDGIFVTDLNCRVGGSYPISHLAGVDLPKQIILWLQGKKTDESLLQCKDGVFATKELVPQAFTPTK
jgi:carbamoyl-phosphate synthase large subunit